jgi:hypothetical protein
LKKIKDKALGIYKKYLEKESLSKGIREVEIILDKNDGSFPVVVGYNDGTSVIVNIKGDKRIATELAMIVFSGGSQ